MNDIDEKSMKNYLKHGKSKYKNAFIAGFGTIAIGIQENEPILSPKILGRDLKLAKQQKIQEVVIFRLGGLNKEYIKTIRKCITKK